MMCRLLPFIFSFLIVLASQQQTWAVRAIELSETSSPIRSISAVAKDGQAAVAVYRKPEGKGPFPAVIIIHGGANPFGTTRLRQNLTKGPLRTRFLAAGYVTVDADFRQMSLDPNSPGSLWDVVAIVEAVKALPEVDPESVVVFGGSGGGSLALELAGITSLAAVGVGEPASVLFTGMMNGRQLRERWALMRDPHRYYTPELAQYTRDKIRRITCPIFIAHGNVHPIKVMNKEIFIPELKAAGKKVTFRLYPGEQHGFYFGKTNSPETFEQFFNDCNTFFKNHLPTQPKAR